MRNRVGSTVGSAVLALALAVLAGPVLAAEPSKGALQDPFSKAFGDVSRHLQNKKLLTGPQQAKTPRKMQLWSASAGAADRYALAMPNDAYGDSATQIRYLDQGWDQATSLSYYFTDQGSQLFDYDLFVNLEQAGNSELFTTPANMSRYRYLPQKASPQNPDALPVGFLKRTANKNNYLSVTCGACHTSQINYKGTGMRIDGAGAQSDFVGFLGGVLHSFDATLADQAKFNRLASRILGANPKNSAVAALRARLQKNRDSLQRYTDINRTELRDGFARVDAVGRIYNQVLSAVHAGEFLKPDAPVSYPFLWDASHHDYVQWLGLTPNAGPGALGRNSGEVIGVFGTINVTKQTKKLEKLFGYPSSVNAMNLVSYEQWLFDLKSPQWPQDILPKLDSARLERGKNLYYQECISCHRSIDRNDPKRLVYAQMYEPAVVGTDTREITNALRSGQTGVLQGALTSVTSNTTYGATAPVAQMLSDLVSGVLIHYTNLKATAKAAEDAKSWGLGLEGPAKQGEYPQEANNPFASLQAYKARPLNGIWATAPFLHNGSVPSLYDLLLPAALRPKRFAVGQLEFDPVKVGHLSDPDSPNAPYVFDTSLPGNGNQGHEFGTQLNEEQRLDLLEYLKSL